MPSQVINFRSVTIDSVTRTAITVPVECAEVVIHNEDTTNDCTLYDAATGGASRVLPAGAERTFRGGGSRPVVWRPEDVVVWATAAAGTGPIRVECHS